MSTLTYIKNFFKDRYVASITPTSQTGVRSICEKIDFDRGRVFVEYGPGTGVITEALLARMRPDAELLLIERNEEFVSILKRQFADARVSVYHADARDVRDVLGGHGVDAADYVISGIPFSLLKRSDRDHVVSETYQILSEGGKFVAYQTFWQADEHLFNYLDRYFDYVNSELTLLSVPPLRLYEAQKNGVSRLGTNGT